MSGSSRHVACQDLETDGEAADTPLSSISVSGCNQTDVNIVRGPSHVYSKRTAAGSMELIFLVLIVLDQPINNQRKKRAFFERVKASFCDGLESGSSKERELCRELNLTDATAKSASDDSVTLTIHVTNQEAKENLNRSYNDGSLAEKLKVKFSALVSEGVQHTICLQEHPVTIAGERVLAEGRASPRETPRTMATDSGNPGGRLLVISNLIAATIKSKTATAYDFYQLLIKNKKDITPMLVKNEDGMNMLHQCVHHQRLPFMEVIHLVGYWDDLISNEIPRQSLSEYAGCNPRVMAQRARQWKLAKEIDRLSEVEHSMSNNSSLLKAVRAADIEQSQGVVNNTRRQVDLSETDYNGSTCIHWACKVGSFPLLKFFKEKGANVHAKDKQENTALHYAANWGHSNLINFLVRMSSVDPTLRNVSGRSALEMTALNGDTKSLEQMARVGVVIEPIVLILAAYAGRLPYVQQCISDHRVDEMSKDKNSKTCLMVAAEQGHKNILKYLLQKFTFKMDDVDNRNRTIFHLVVAKNMASAGDCAKLIIEEARKQGMLPRVLNMKDRYRLEYDCYTIRGLDNGRPAWHHIHLKRQMQPYFDKASRGGTIDAGIIGQPITSGWDEQPTPEYLRSCVEEHKRTNTTKDGQEDIAPLSYALLKDKPDVAKLYIAAGAALDTRDCYGLYPLHMAVMAGNKELSNLLTSKGASLNVRDENDKTPIDLARDNNQFEIVSYLESDAMITKGQEFKDTIVSKIEREFGREKLEEVRNSDADVKRHLVDTARQLQAQINMFLKDIGSGPVLEESGGNEPMPAVATALLGLGDVEAPPFFMPGANVALDERLLQTLEENLDSTAHHTQHP